MTIIATQPETVNSFLNLSITARNDTTYHQTTKEPSFDSISPTDRRLLEKIGDYITSGRQLFAHQSTLSKWLTIPIRTLKRCTARLLKSGLIEVNRPNKRMGNIYNLTSKGVSWLYHKSQKLGNRLRQIYSKSVLESAVDKVVDKLRINIDNGPSKTSKVAPHILLGSDTKNKINYITEKSASKREESLITFRKEESEGAEVMQKPLSDPQINWRQKENGLIHKEAILRTKQRIIESGLDVDKLPYSVYEALLKRYSNEVQNEFIARRYTASSNPFTFLEKKYGREDFRFS